MRRVYHVARADFLQRVRSRRLVVVLAIVAFFGYLVNVGQIELAYQIENGDALTNVRGANTAAFVGLKAGMTGSMVLLFGGFYLMKGAVGRDRTYNVARLVASTTVSDRTYLLGKWVSNIGLGVVVLVTLAIATVVNHVVHGVGPTKLVALVGPIFVLALPLSALVGAVAVLFESVDRLSGTLGNIGYFFLATFALAGLQSAAGQLPSEMPLWVKSVDLMGHLSVYALTADALLTAVPDAGGVLPSFGTLTGDGPTFRYEGRSWPLWVYAQRAGLVLPAIGTILVATLPFERRPSEADSRTGGWRSRLATLVPTVDRGGDATTEASDPPAVESMSLTRVETRTAWSFWRLVAAETRLAVRGRRWWWYVGTGALIVAPVAVLATAASGDSIDLARRVLVPLAFIWPIFVWSELGVRVTNHRMTDLVLSSNHPIGQLLAEWVAGVVVAVGVSSGLLALFVATGQIGALVGIASAALFAPSLAVAAGVWSRSSWLFEMSYLLVWYVGPLNGAEPVDFVGTTAASVGTGVPFVFMGLSVVLVGTALAHRKMLLRR
ncbi:hypothetical protein [Natronoarchaeum rubrum]|uniref:hypothetical protein n=1 Tax=Natronoarchaeum rubrum TaxID=755311 RepID=UPI0021113394|nr:hypothetical protein [Natronoarchaeum rubrum]